MFPKRRLAAVVKAGKLEKDERIKVQLAPYLLRQPPCHVWKQGRKDLGSAY
jgi:hypothetical protein